MLDQGLADALHHAALDLAAHDHRIEHAAEVVDDEIRSSVTSPVSGSTSSSQTCEPLGWLGGLGAEAAARLEADAELLRQRPHRRIGTPWRRRPA